MQNKRKVQNDNNTSLKKTSISVTRPYVHISAGRHSNIFHNEKDLNIFKSLVLLLEGGREREAFRRGAQ
uniref:Uncharacterized protein n=1 Tax=Glossina brevipalpis TaxID=37001 RepID=A0A1A9WH50_9MUSC